MRLGFSEIIKDNEEAAVRALVQGEFIQAYVLLHTLIEALLRLFLRIPEEKETTFHQLVQKYRSFLEHERYPFPTFLDELTTFNQRRNRIVHQLWGKGYSLSNSQTEPAARGAVVMYGLLVEWLETFDPEITEMGLQYDEGA